MYAVPKDSEPASQHYTQNYKFPQKIWLKVLNALKDKRSAAYLELGVFEGRSLVWISNNILPATSRADALDHFVVPGSLERFYKNVESLRLTKEVRVLQGWCAEILPTLSKLDYDLIYVDADHSYFHVWNDLVRAWPLLKTGGYMVMDDYIWFKYLIPSSERPEQAIDDFLKESHDSCLLIFKGVQVFVQKTAELPVTMKVIESHSRQIPAKVDLPPKLIGRFLLFCLYRFYDLKQFIFLLNRR